MIENQEQGKKSNASELTNAAAETKLIDTVLVADMTIAQLIDKLSLELATANTQRNALEVNEQNILFLMETLKSRGQSLDEIMPV